jgi:hypothetical protein
VKQKPGGGGGGGVEARDFTVSEGHGHPLVIMRLHMCDFWHLIYFCFVTLALTFVF